MGDNFLITRRYKIRYTYEYNFFFFKEVKPIFIYLFIYFDN